MTEIEAIEAIKGIKALVDLPVMYYGEQEDELGQARQISELVLFENAVTDDTLRSVVGYLSFLPYLEFLDLGGNALTDDALPLLSHLTQLKRIDLENNDLTTAAVDALRKRLPGCQINLELPDA